MFLTKRETILLTELMNSNGPVFYGPNDAAFESK